MKLRRIALLLVPAIPAVVAQEAAPLTAPTAETPAPQVSPPESVENVSPPSPGVSIAVKRTAEELEQLLAPVALYPDALIALILPASTVPTDIVLAARHLRDNPGDRSQIEHRAWDESVKSLTNYPEVLKWMDENLHWTRQVGEAFVAQPAEVMQAIQRLRAKARAAGTLADTPQQQVIMDQQVIRIVPAQPDIIYVPHYQPEVVFVDRPVYYTHPLITFGVGVPVGSWLAFDCDWHHHRIWVGDRHRHWRGHDWRQPLVPFSHSHHSSHSVRNHYGVRKPDVRVWTPPRVPRITVTSSNRFRSEIARPAPLGFASQTTTFRDPFTSRTPAIRSSNVVSRPPSFTEPPTQRFHGSRFTGRHDGHSHEVRGGSSTRNHAVVNPPPVVPAMPRHFSPGFQAQSTGPRATTSVVAPPLPTARANNVQAPATVNVQPAPRPNRIGRSHDGTRDFGNRSRSFRSSQPTVTAPLPVAPAAPMAAAPIRTVPAPGPGRNRSFSQRAGTPAVVPALPLHSHTQASTPATVGPVAPQAAPQAAPAPSRQSAQGGREIRGHRGAVIRR